MFEKAGRYKVTIQDAYCAERSNFPDTPQNAINIAVEVQEIDGPGEGAWTGEVSDRYGIGNASGKQQTQMTAEALIATGWTANGMDAPALIKFIETAHHREDYPAIDALLESMRGQETTVSVEETKKGALVIKYLGGGAWKPKRLVPRNGDPVANPFA